MKKVGLSDRTPNFDLETRFKFTAHSLSDGSLWMKYETRGENIPVKNFKQISYLTLTFNPEIGSMSLHTLYPKVLCWYEPE